MLWEPVTQTGHVPGLEMAGSQQPLGSYYHRLPWSFVLRGCLLSELPSSVCPGPVSSLGVRCPRMDTGLEGPGTYMFTWLYYDPATGELAYLFSGHNCAEALSSGILFLSWLRLVTTEASRHKCSAENGTELVEHYTCLFLT